MFKLYLFFICIIQIHITYSQVVFMSDPIQHLNQLQQQIKSNIFSINQHYSQLTRNLQETIQNTISQTSILASIQKLQSNIYDYHSSSSKCSTLTETAISLLSTSSKEDVSSCASTAVSLLTNNITLEAERLITKFTSVEGDITERIANCFKSNLINELGLALCLLAQINPVESDIASVMQDIETTFALSEAVAQEIIFNLSNCVLNVQDIVDKTAARINTDFRGCSNI